MRAAVSTLTCWLPCNARETVECETWARRAMSLMDVARVCCATGILSRLAHVCEVPHSVMPLFRSDVNTNGLTCRWIDNIIAHVAANVCDMRPRCVRYLH